MHNFDKRRLLATFQYQNKKEKSGNVFLFEIADVLSNAFYFRWQIILTTQQNLLVKILLSFIWTCKVWNMDSEMKFDELGDELGDWELAYFPIGNDGVDYLFDDDGKKAQGVYKGIGNEVKSFFII